MSKPVISMSKSRSRLDNSSELELASSSSSHPANSARRLSVSTKARFRSGVRCFTRMVRHLGHAQELGRFHPGVAGQDDVVLVHYNRYENPELLDGGGKQLDLLSAMGARVARVGLQLLRGPVLDYGLTWLQSCGNAGRTGPLR